MYPFRFAMSFRVLIIFRASNTESSVTEVTPVWCGLSTRRGARAVYLKRTGSTLISFIALGIAALSASASLPLMNEDGQS